MKFLVKWFDLDEVVDSALVSYFHAMRLMKGEGIEESTASLCLCYAVKGCPLQVTTNDGYVLTLEKVEG
jgi:hypothetical protein